MNKPTLAFVRRLLPAVPALLAFALAGAPARAAVPTAFVASALAGQANTGTIKGKVVWGGAEAPPQKTLVEVGKANKDGNVCAAKAPIPDNKLVVDPKTKGVKYVVVYLVKPKGENPDAAKALLAKAPEAVIDQQNCEFLPFVTAVHQDQKVVFKSSDPVSHNVHLTPFTNKPINQMLPPKGEMAQKFVAERRAIQMTCDIHPWMTGYLLVFDHPFFATTGDDGTFEIKGVPAGAQSYVVWLSSAGYVNSKKGPGDPVNVEAGKTADLGEIKVSPASIK